MEFELDPQAPGCIAGWIAAGDAPVWLQIRLDGVVVGAVEAGLPRADRHESGRRPSGSCGFRVTEAEAPGLTSAGTIEILAGDLTLYRAQRFGQLARERLFLMHIPKTGGTSLNHVLSPLFENAYTHLEGRGEAELRSILRLGAPRSLFLSGHLLFNSVAPHLLERPTRLATLLRNPADHLISHLAWLFRIAQDPAHLSAHHPAIREVAERVARIDPADEGSFGAWTESLTATDRQLFFNLQTRYLGSGRPEGHASESDLACARETLRRFDVVGRLERLETFARRLDRVLGLDLGPIPRMRANPDVERFRPLLRFERLIQPFVELDEVVYADVVAHEGVAGRLRSGWRAIAGG